MDIDRFQKDLRYIVQILDPYITLNGENYIYDPAFRNDLSMVREPVMKLLTMVDHIILKKKIHDLKHGLDDDLTDKIEEILGIN